MPDKLGDLRSANRETQEAWNHNADYWDDRIGEGNDFVDVLIWPSTRQLLGLRGGERVLDVACGNGLYARRMARLGAQVVAIDFSERLIDHARRRGQRGDSIEYRVLDATDADELLSLGTNAFDVTVCQMALFDISDINPLVKSLPLLLRPGGRFLFSVMHPCFNNPHATHVAEMEDREGDVVTVFGIKVTSYLSQTTARGAAIAGQPRPHVYFHRPLQKLLGVCFDNGFVMDALEERAFPSDHAAGPNPLSWGRNYSEIPPVLIARMRLPG
jgi:2-polyprenyl-3-methyl-5-hydroxy-6-metoxy-1,4-benzoquinol methylase